MIRKSHIPTVINKPIFQKAFETAALAGLNAEQRDSYEQSLIQYRDLKSAMETAVEEATLVIARNGIAEGLDTGLIARLTGLSPQQIEQLRSETRK